jgi:hypothetical protein
MGLIALLIIIGACAHNLWLVGPQARANSVMLAASFVTALIGMSATTLARTLKGYRS